MEQALLPEHVKSPPRRNYPFRLLLALAAFIAVLVGQSALKDGQTKSGAIAIGLGALTFVLALWNQPGVEIQLTAESQSLPKSFPRKIPLVISILLAVPAFWLFDTNVPQIIPWLLHFASIGLLVLSALFLDHKSPAKDTPPNWTFLEAGIFLFILAIAAFMRLYRFDEIPFGLWYDEADNGLVALDILNKPGYLPVFATTLPAHFFYLIAFSFKILGVSALSIRAVSVAFGLATVVVSFFLGRELFDRRMGLVLAFFFAASRWDVNWSRIGMHGVSVPFFEVLSVWLVLRALRRQRLADYTLAGLSLGMGFCFYTPLFLFPVVIGIFLLYLGFYKPASLSRRGIVLLTIGVFVASVPISQFIIRHPETFFDRLQVTSIFTGKSFREGWAAIARTTPEHLLMFNYRGDENGRHNLPGEPMLDPVSGALMLLGLALSLRRSHQPLSVMLVVWLLVMLLPGILSLEFESPQSLRAIGSLPPAYLLAAIPVYAAWQGWESLRGKQCHFVFIFPLLLFLIKMGYDNYYAYFDLQAERADVWGVFSTPETIIGRTMAELGTDADAYLSVYFYDSPTIRFLAPEGQDYQLLQTDEALPIPGVDGKTTVFFIDPYNESYFLQAREQNHQNASYIEHRAPNGAVILYQITIEP